MKFIHGFISCLCALATGSAVAAPVLTNITATVVSASGVQLPVHLLVNDTVTFSYLYDDAGDVAHYFNTDGSVSTVPIATYPQMLTLSDATVAYSANLLETMGEYHGTSGFQEFNANWVWTESNGAQYFQDMISPSTLVHMGYMPAIGLSPFPEGYMILWGLDSSGVDVVGATVFFDWTAVSTTSVPEPESLALVGFGLLGLLAMRRNPLRNSLLAGTF